MNTLIITKEEALKKYSKEFINLVIDTSKQIDSFFGIDVFVTSEDIPKAILLDRRDLK